MTVLEISRTNRPSSTSCKLAQISSKFGKDSFSSTNSHQQQHKTISIALNCYSSYQKISSSIPPRMHVDRTKPTYYLRKLMTPPAEANRQNYKEVTPEKCP